jgi:hypothetical protein
MTYLRLIPAVLCESLQAVREMAFNAERGFASKVETERQRVW